jgi:hypothetical protein
MTRIATLHTRRRLTERYGLWLTKSELEDLLRRVQRGRGIGVRVVERKRRHTTFDVDIQYDDLSAHTVRVVYDRERKEITTALPKTQ